jgi:hypothetical protein
MWEKMVGKRPGIILECNGRLPIEMVKGDVDVLSMMCFSQRE